MVIDGGFHEVSAADIPGVLADAARQGVPVFTLSTAGRTDKEAFFGSVGRALPLDPPLGTSRMVGGRPLGFGLGWAPCASDSPRGHRLARRPSCRDRPG
jgi:hypothetical protein